MPPDVDAQLTIEGKAYDRGDENAGMAVHKMTPRAGKRARFARNAAMFSGLAAGAFVIVGIMSGSATLAVLPTVSLLLAVAGVIIWARQERRQKQSDS